MAAKEQQLELQAHGLYLKIRSQNLQERSHGASGGLLGQLETLLSTPSLKESQLQVYSRLLRTNASIEAHQSTKPSASWPKPAAGRIRPRIRWPAPGSAR